jgi:hypothetical protein
VIGGAGYRFSHRPGTLQQQEAVDLQKEFEVFNAVVKGFTLPDILSASTSVPPHWLGGAAALEAAATPDREKRMAETWAAAANPARLGQRYDRARASQ